jgi:AbrB family looped-hinge helix DNA binding protein
MPEIATTTMSSKGQVVIPDKIRDLLNLKQGTEFVVLSSEGTVILKPIFAGDFSSMLTQAKKEAKKARITKSALKKTIKSVRKGK